MQPILHTQDAALSASVRTARFLFALLAWIFAACLIVQVFIAGMATFSDSAHWELHRQFVKLFAFVPLLMFVMALIGKMPGRKRWVSIGSFALVIFQFLTVQLFSSAWVLASLHPVIALLLFWGAVTMVKDSRPAGKATA